MTYDIGFIIVIFISTSLFFTYLFFAYVQAVIYKKTLGYISKVKIKSFNFFNFTFRVTIYSSLLSGSHLEISSISLKFSGFLKVKLTLPKEITFSNNTIVKSIVSDFKPIFLINLFRKNSVELESPIYINILDRAKNNVVEGNLHITKLTFTNNFGTNPNSDILLKYDLEYEGSNYQSLDIHFLLYYGISQRSKSKYMKSYEIKHGNIRYANSQINIKGGLKYELLVNPIGQLKIEISNPDSIVDDIFPNETTDETSGIASRMKQFIQLVKDRNGSDNNVLQIDCKFEKSGVIINDFKLEDIAQSY